MVDQNGPHGHVVLFFSSPKGVDIATTGGAILRWSERTTATLQRVPPTLLRCASASAFDTLQVADCPVLNVFLAGSASALAVSAVHPSENRSTML